VFSLENAAQLFPSWAFRAFSPSTECGSFLLPPTLLLATDVPYGFYSLLKSFFGSDSVSPEALGVVTFLFSPCPLPPLALCFFLPRGQICFPHSFPSFISNEQTWVQFPPLFPPPLLQPFDQPNGNHPRFSVFPSWLLPPRNYFIP